jgi:hypothetical protein
MIIYFFVLKVIPYNNYIIIYIAKDITNEKKYKEILNYIKNKDSLTGF